MGLLLCLLLRLVHVIYFLVLRCSARWRTRSEPAPWPLSAPRIRIPKHLALLLVLDGHTDAETTECVSQTVQRAVDWCRQLGVEKLTLYDRDGLACRASHEIEERISGFQLPFRCDESSESEIEYPLTPPLSRPISPADDDFRVPDGLVVLPESCMPQEKLSSTRFKSLRRRVSTARKHLSASLSVHLVSYSASKSMVAAAATLLARKRGEPGTSITVDQLDTLLEGKHGLPAPDFMIIHHLFPPQIQHAPLELHGFPPWQVRLTELYHNQPDVPRRLRDRVLRRKVVPQPLDEIAFRRALDEFAGAEMRFGK